MSTWFKDKVGSAGVPLGPRLEASQFVPFGVGLVFEGNNGDFYSLQLAYDDDGNAKLDIVPVQI